MRIARVHFVSVFRVGILHTLYLIKNTLKHSSIQKPLFKNTIQKSYELPCLNGPIPQV